MFEHLLRELNSLSGTGISVSLSTDSHRPGRGGWRRRFQSAMPKAHQRHHL
jgi:hypothetical protein